MRLQMSIVLALICLTGCSELRVIGAAAMRELRAEAVPVNWNKSVPERPSFRSDEPLVMVADGKVRSFSSFRSSSKGLKRPVKGLWEQHGG